MQGGRARKGLHVGRGDEALAKGKLRLPSEFIPVRNQLETSLAVRFAGYALNDPWAAFVRTRTRPWKFHILDSLGHLVV